VAHHLRMSLAAFRRDTEDPEVVRQFAALVGVEDRLKMLCLMTLADVEAVSPETLTPWKEELLWRLYVDTYNRLTLGHGEELIGEDTTSLQAVLDARPHDITPEALEAFLDGLPERYLRAGDATRVFEHVRLASVVGPDGLRCALQ